LIRTCPRFLRKRKSSSDAKTDKEELLGEKGQRRLIIATRNLGSLAEALGARDASGTCFKGHEESVSGIVGGSGGGESIDLFFFSLRFIYNFRIELILRVSEMGEVSPLTKPSPRRSEIGGSLVFKYAAEMRGDQKGSLVRWDGTGVSAYEGDRRPTTRFTGSDGGRGMGDG